jgi:hypothetical protein
VDEYVRQQAIEFGGQHNVGGLSSCGEVILWLNR